MIKKFDAGRFSRNYYNYKAASHKYRQESQQQGSLFVIDLRVIVSDETGRSTVIQDFALYLKLFEELPVRENVGFEIRPSWALLQYLKEMASRIADNTDRMRYFLGFFRLHQDSEIIVLQFRLRR